MERTQYLRIAGRQVEQRSRKIRFILQIHPFDGRLHRDTSRSRRQFPPTSRSTIHESFRRCPRAFKKQRPAIARAHPSPRRPASARAPKRCRRASRTVPPSGHGGKSIGPGFFPESEPSPAFIGPEPASQGTKSSGGYPPPAGRAIRSPRGGPSASANVPSAHPGTAGVRTDDLYRMIVTGTPQPGAAGTKRRLRTWERRSQGSDVAESKAGW